MYLIRQYYEMQYQQKMEFIQSKLITSLPQYHFRCNIPGIKNSDKDIWISDLKFGIDVKTSTLYAKPEILKMNMCKFWYFASVQPKHSDMIITKQVGLKSFTYLNLKSDKIWDVNNYEVVEQGFYPLKGFTSEFLPDRFISSDRFIEWLDSKKPQI
jgi:hypothetical protein